MNALVIIDPQNSFCDPQKGELYVPGAEKDMERLAEWIKVNKQNIDFILVSLDTHFYNDISHPNFWRDINNNKPEPFTQIKYTDVIEGRWLPIEDPERVKIYLRELEKQGEYNHVIWPEHCLIGSEGNAIFPPLYEALKQWSDSNLKDFYPLIKGLYRFSEHFGIFRAQVVFDDVPETKPKIDILNKLDDFDTIFIAGEAKSHCVANTIKQIDELKPDLLEKTIIIEDAMSNVPGFEHIADKIYETAQIKGAHFAKTTEITL